MSMKHFCALNMMSFEKDNYNKMVNEIFLKVKKDLKNKYNSLIYEKNYNIDSFDKILKKLIINYNYLNNQNYNTLLIKVEKHFLKDLAKYEDIQRNLLSKKNIRNLSEQPYFYFNEDEILKKKNKPFKSNVKLSNKEKDIWNLNQRALEIEVEKRLQKNNKN